MDYKEAINYIENTGKFGINLGLERVEKLCELMGNPQRDLKFIHIAGTNGKGSTTSFISSILMRQGYRVGIYTSPYIERFTERIKINYDEIGKVEIAELVSEIKPIIEKLVQKGFEHPTEFEIITACAFRYFKEKHVDYVVLEVGLGGRYDATNVVTPLLSVITTISYDHMNVLGNTLSKIANEKAGIIKQNVPVVIYPQEDEVMEVLLNYAKLQNSKVYQTREMKYKIVSNTVDGIVFDVSGEREYKGIKIKLLGAHQVINAITAIKSAEVLNEIGVSIGEKSIYDGLDRARWPGRFEIIKREPYIVLDGGHNIQGIESLVNAAKTYFPRRDITIMCGMLKDKDYRDMAGKLCEVSDSFITVEPNSPRALKAEELRDVFEEFGKEAVTAEDIAQGVQIGLNMVKNDEVLIICGSLYMIGEARGILKRILEEARQ